MATPGFLENSIDFDQLTAHYLKNNCYIEITDPAEVSLAIKIMEHVIDTSFGYAEDSTDFSAKVHGRFQMIFNSTLEEVNMEKAGLIKRSNAVWSLTGSYEPGTDFVSDNGKQIEAKVYKNFGSMLNYAKKGSLDYTVFHGAEYVLCYLIDSYQLDNSSKFKHWYWLKKINGVYVVYNDIELYNITEECLPDSLPVCYCKLRDNKLIIGKNTFCV